VPSEEPTLQDMADVYLAEYLSETHGEPVSPSGRRPVTYIVYQTGDHFNLYCVFDRDNSSASNHHELLFRCVWYVCVVLWEKVTYNITFTLPVIVTSVVKVIPPVSGRGQIYPSHQTHIP